MLIVGHHTSLHLTRPRSQTVAAKRAEEKKRRKIRALHQQSLAARVAKQNQTQNQLPQEGIGTMSKTKKKTNSQSSSGRKDKHRSARSTGRSSRRHPNNNHHLSDTGESKGSLGVGRTVAFEKSATKRRTVKAVNATQWQQRKERQKTVSMVTVGNNGVQQQQQRQRQRQQSSALVHNGAGVPLQSSPTSEHHDQQQEQDHRPGYPAAKKMSDDEFIERELQASLNAFSGDPELTEINPSLSRGLYMSSALN